MVLQKRKESIEPVSSKYRQASWIEGSKLLDGFVEITGYQRKYVIRLLNRKRSKND
jgi:hypothetical protein